MSDDLDLDASTVAAQLDAPRVRVHASPWHARRAYGFGASDVPALLVGLGLRVGLDTPGHVAANAAHVRGRPGIPRLIAEKAGVKPPLSAGRAAAIGTMREAELVAAWAASLGPLDAIDGASVVHASVVPRELQAAIRDPECAWLAASLDAWARDALGDVVVVEAKCGHLDREACPWHWRAQVQAQLACTGLALGLVVFGQQWARSETARGPIVVWPVERDEAEIAEIRGACVRGWQMVETLRGNQGGE